MLPSAARSEGVRNAEGEELELQQLGMHVSEEHCQSTVDRLQ